MSVPPDNQPVTTENAPAAPPTSPVPIRAGSTNNSQMRRSWIWLGLFLIICGTFLLGDTARRFEFVWELMLAWWPWALLGLALLIVVRSTLRLESVFVPGLIASIGGLGLAVKYGLTAKVLVDVLVPASLVGGGIALLFAKTGKTPQSWTKFLWSGRVYAPEAAREPLRPRVFLGDIRVDMTTVRPEELDVTIDATMVLGHIHFDIPKDWFVTLKDSTLASRILDKRRNGNEGDSTLLVLNVLGFGGIVTIARV